jgi:hypothetical protein
MTTCTWFFPPETPVTLSHIAEPDSRFMGWGGQCSGDGPCGLLLVASPGPGPVVEASFLGPRSITVNLTGFEGGRGSVFVSPQPIGGVPDVCANNSGTPMTTCTWFFPPETPVTLSHIAEPDSRFMGWGGGTCAGDGPCGVTLIAAPGPGPIVDAPFLGPRTLTLTLDSRRGGHGTVTVGPPSVDGLDTCVLPQGSDTTACTLRYRPDTVVEVFAQPAPGSAFVEWSNGPCAGGGPCRVMLLPAAVTALFEVPNRAPVANAGGPHSGVRGQPIGFDGSGSADPDADPLTYAWTFGDGATGTGPAPTHAYASVGVFTVTLVVHDGLLSSAPATTTVTIDNLPPVVSLASPTAGAVFTAPATIPVSALATDPDGTVALVEFFAGPQKIGEAAAPPYAVAWNAVPPGAYALTARVTDETGASTASAPVNILVNAPPAVNLTAPANGAVFTAPASVSLAATASDPDGSIVAVEFFRDATSLGTDTTAPYALVWTNAPAGTYALTARAVDDRGAAATSAPVTITVRTRVTAVADAHVRDGSANANRNFGSAASLEVRTGSSGNTRWTYLRFNTSAAPTAGRAVLRMFGRLSATSGTTITTSVFPSSNTTWSESGLTWNNRPATGATALASVTMVNSTTARWYEWDVTAYLQQEKAAGRHVVTLVLKNAASSTPHDLFNSDESGSNVPELIVDP